jgi:uncharacterized protein with von Willebrand factor type A (vWA) domain
MTPFLHNLLRFGGLLHTLGLDVHAGRMVDVVAALQHVDLARRSDFYFTLRSLLVHRQQDLAPFDEAFRLFWRPPPGEWSANDLRAMGEKRRFGPPRVDIPPSEPAAADDGSAPSVTEPVERVEAMSYSDRDVPRSKDFADFTESELERAKTLIEQLRWDVGRRRTRRWTPGRGRVPDIRRMVRRNMRYGGELIDLPTRTRTLKRRPLVVICDVSGSMERYARMLLHFTHGLAGGFGRTEAFFFATRLTRVTRELTRRGAAHDLPTIPRLVPDWGGGTRIGDALHAFNVRWTRRVLGHGAVVLLVSDGWDRGDPDSLRREISRLQRSCYRLIWLNPLLGSPEYQPLTRGMQAALPFVDDFLPVHNLASLEALAEHLNRLPEHRSTRRTHAGPPVDNSRQEMN